MKPSNDREAITLILEGLQADGWVLTRVNDSEESYRLGNNITRAVGHVTDVDFAHVFMERGEETGWVWFVLGNDPEEVAADYSTNLDPTLSNIVDPWWN